MSVSTSTAVAATAAVSAAATNRMVVARAGSTEYDEQGRIAGTLDLPLSPRGEAEVAALEIEFRGFAFAAVYSAPDEASRETARRLAAAQGVKARVLDGLRGQDFGGWQGLTFDEWRRKFPKVAKQQDEDPASVTPPNGEALGAVLARVRKALQPALRRHARETALVVVPAALRPALASLLRGGAPPAPWPEGAAELPAWEALDLVPRGRTAP